MGILISMPDESRLSEEVVSRAILKFFMEHHKLPTGVGLEVVEKWADKMAYGLREAASRFKRLLWASSHGAKSKKSRKQKKNIGNLLERLLKRNLLKNRPSIRYKLCKKQGLTG